MATKQQKLDLIKQQIIDNNICPELKSGASQLVFGEGNLKADVLFIGEAPGKQEDQQGRPFVGPAGQILNDMLATIDLKREDVYITNIVKYRPANNRDPYPEEKAAFLPYLEAQLDVIQPKLIVTLGRHSLNCFLPDLQISTCHGQPKRYRGRVYLPLFHPAAALYNGSLRQTLTDDFKRIPKIIQLSQRI
ncbi:MAG TPA: uracil-DNA glycosylase [Candidatus Dormibacteraeota bacterium]|nr:uracil-DNA glycosylase [Candidatus Dormibacteraeota bacterium]